jgi:hypothetical protein
MNSETLTALATKWRQMAREYRYNPAAMTFTADRMEGCANDLEAALRALESTQAQEPVAWACTDYQDEGPNTQYTRDKHAADYYESLGIEVVPLYDLAALSARTAPAEGEAQEAIDTMVSLGWRWNGELWQAPAEGDVVAWRVESKGEPELGFWFQEHAPSDALIGRPLVFGDTMTATTAPVVGDDHATDEEIAEWLERHDLTGAIRGGDARCAFEDAQTFAMTKATARPAKAEGDAQDAARYRWLRDRNGAQDDGVPVEIFIDEEAYSPGFLDEQVDAAMGAGRTVSRGESNG